jgi:hypothetical protein
LGSGGAAVLFHIAEAFLNDAEEGQRHVGGDRPRDILVRKVDLDALLFAKLCTEGAYPENYAEAFQGRRVQLMGEGMKISADLAGAVPESRRKP